MTKSRDEQINDLVATLSRVRKERPEDYEARVKQYRDMLEGGDGGPWRAGADSSIRELHYQGWTDENFQDVLELLDEVPLMDEEERAERFQHERSFWSKIKKTLGG